MDKQEHLKFVLASGSKVREEDFGLLFYSMYGPKLFFVSCGKELAPEFFDGKNDLNRWLSKQGENALASIEKLASCLQKLAAKGVIRGV